MRLEFVNLANQVRRALEKRYSGSDFSDDYLYASICRMVNEVEAGKLASVAPDIGVAAVKLFDSDEPGDVHLRAQIQELSRLYVRMQKSGVK